MMFRTSVCLMLLLCLELSLGLVQDQSRVEGSRGSEVVEVVANRIRDSCVFPDFKLLLRRIAFVQTADGQNTDTYTPSYDGGIWKVDKSIFDTTKTSSKANALYNDINSMFAIDWNRVQWHDLRKPLYSGLACALFLATLDEEIPRNLEKQGPYFEKYFRSNKDPSGHFYFEQVNKMTAVCQQANLDLAFVVDSSSSLSQSDFNNAKSFAHKIVQNFDIGSVRVAFVIFNTGYQLQFDFGTHPDKTSLLNAIDNIQTSGGQTDTDKALDFVAKELFTPSHGSRPGTSKVVLLLTDGVSTQHADTVTAAQQAQSDGIVIFTIGVGGGINAGELTQIADKPQCTHVIILAGYGDLGELVDQIQQISCKAAAILGPGTYTFPCSQVGLFQFLARGIDQQVTITNSDGQVNIYGSLTNPTPNQAVYSFTSSVMPGLTSAILLTKQTNPVYVQVSSAPSPNECTGTYTVKVGSVERVEPTAEVTCVERDLARGCSVVNIYGRVYDLLSPPYAIVNICHALRSPAWYPEKDDQMRYVFCGRNETMYVFQCDQHHIYNHPQRMCVPGEPSTTTLRTTTTTTSTTTTTTTTTTTPTTTSIPSTQRSTGGNPCTAENVKNNNYFFPYYPDPAKYIDCSNWPTWGYIKDCPKGKVWDQRDLTCTFRFVVVNATSMIWSHIPNPCITRLQDGDLFYYPHPTDIKMYIQCDQYGDGFLKVCPERRIWNQVLLQCVPNNLLLINNNP